MTDGEWAEGAFHHKRLGVEELRRAGGRIAGMTDGHVSVERAQFVFGEDLSNQTHVFVEIDAPAVSDCNASAFLATVLKCI